MDENRFQSAIDLRDSGHCEEAILEFHNLAAEACSPEEKAALLINEHRCYCQLGRLHDAERLIRIIRGLELKDSDIRLTVDFGEACMHVQMGELETGLLEFEKILASYPTLLQSSHRDLYEKIQIRRGVSLFHLKRYSEACAILTEASAFTDLEAEDEQEVHFYLGGCYEKGREIALAKEEYLRAIAFDTNSDISIHARYQVALIYFKAGAFAQAKLHLEAILQTCNKDIPNLPIKYVYEQLSHVLRYMGLKEDALRYSKLAKTSQKE